MIMKKILNFLKDFLKKEGPDKKYTDNMKKILKRLNDKAQLLEIQLETEEDEIKRNNIILMLKVISKKQKKGENLIKERELQFRSSGKNKIKSRPELSPRI